MEKCIVLSLSNRLTLSCKKDSSNKLNSKGIGNAFLHCLPFFYYFAKGVYGNIRDKLVSLRGQSRALTVWSAGSFV